MSDLQRLVERFQPKSAPRTCEIVLDNYEPREDGKIYLIARNTCPDRVMKSQLGVDKQEWIEKEQTYPGKDEFDKITKCEDDPEQPDLILCTISLGGPKKPSIDAFGIALAPGAFGMQSMQTM